MAVGESVFYMPVSLCISVGECFVSVTVCFPSMRVCFVC